MEHPKSRAKKSTGICLFRKGACKFVGTGFFVSFLFYSFLCLQRGVGNRKAKSDGVSMSKIMESISGAERVYRQRGRKFSRFSLGTGIFYSDASMC